MTSRQAEEVLRQIRSLIHLIEEDIEEWRRKTDGKFSEAYIMTREFQIDQLYKMMVLILQQAG